MLDIVATSPKPARKMIREQLGSIGGLVVGDILPGSPFYGAVRGVQILEVPPKSASEAAGLNAGDIIVGIDGERTASADDLVRRLELANVQYRLEIVRGGASAWVRMNH